MIERIVVFGKEVELPRPIEEDRLTEGQIVSILRDIDPKLAGEVENAEYRTRVEGNTIVLYRIGAVFG